VKTAVLLRSSPEWHLGVKKDGCSCRLSELHHKLGSKQFTAKGEIVSCQHILTGLHCGHNRKEHSPMCNILTSFGHFSPDSNSSALSNEDG